MELIPPNHTLYVNNLNEKIQKQELRKCLFHFFSQFGNVIDVVALKTMKMRGQAFIVFDDINSASRALRECQNTPFFGKNMRSSFAKSKSYATSIREGDFKKLLPKRKERENESIDDNVSKKIKLGAQVTLAPLIPEEEEIEQEPTNILFVKNLPLDANELMLAMLFRQCDGFLGARLPEGKPGIAFVDYENENLASRARDALQGFKISPTNTLKISFLK